tara:strand:+ start:365 stop:742 length:378 start_codon:yes stop_codon:yes gene_type:complete
MHKQSSAFTLIEVLVALVILAIALLAGVKAIGSSARSEHAVQQRSTAMWVADQLVAEVQLNLLDISANSFQQGSIQMLGESWPWQVRVTQANVNGKQINISVSDPANHRALATLTTFVSALEGRR